MKPKYIKDAIIWDGNFKHWVRISDINLVTYFGEERYTPASRAGSAIYLIDTAFPYEDWMEEYIGTNKKLQEDERFSFNEEETINMEPYQERMLKELEELTERVDKLHKFIGDAEKTRDLPAEKLDLLLKQYYYMSMYQHVLRLRCGMEGIA